MSELISGNVFIRPMAFEKAGEAREGHTHNFDHTWYVVRGAARAELLDDSDAVVRAIDKRASDGHNWVLIAAGKKHRITALDDDTLCHCIYAHRNPQGEIVQEYDGWMPAYE